MKKATIQIKGTPAISGNEGEPFELITDGEYALENGVSTFSYIECGLTGIEGYLTTFDVEPDRVVLRRSDGYAGDMIFAEDKKHHFLYDTPYGSVTMGIDTHSIIKNLRDDGGNLEIRYDISVDNISVSRNLFEISITTQ